MDTAQWPEGIEVVNKSMEVEKKQQKTQQQQQQIKPQASNCPRCNSSHTKFCYYNNYSLSQPRYFCKTCRRYWTEGGSLRNVPVGGGSRKNNKRSSSSSPSSSHLQSASSKITKLDYHQMGSPVTTHISHHHQQNPNKIIKIHDQQGQDLNLAYPQQPPEFTNLPFNQQQEINKTYPATSLPPQFSAMEFLKSGMASRGFMSSFISMPMQMPVMPVSDSNTNSMNHNIYSSVAAAGIPFQEFKPSLGFSLDGFESSGYNSNGAIQENGNGNGDHDIDNTSASARLFFPFEELKPTATEEVLDHHQQNRDGQDQDDSNGYWNGGGSW